MELFLSCCLIPIGVGNGFAFQTGTATSPAPPQAAAQSPAQLQQLVAPIALYPDGLIAQILPAAPGGEWDSLKVIDWQKKQISSHHSGVVAVQLNSSETVRGDIVMKPAEVTQVVTVQENPNHVSVDPSQNAEAPVIKGADLDALPDDTDDLQHYLQALAGPSAGPNGSEILVDGFSSGRLPRKESIREIRINQNPFSAEYDTPGFGRIEIFTEPGSDKFHGTAFYRTTPRSHMARRRLGIRRKGIVGGKAFWQRQLNAIAVDSSTQTEGSGYVSLSESDHRDWTAECTGCDWVRPNSIAYLSAATLERRPSAQKFNKLGSIDCRSAVA